ncbi:MAG: hypothetical protein F6K31_26160, partial [Symploca sp. SIO2G7]|nr:hypothetical protein [Symploca sp. SIO2G7]
AQKAARGAAKECLNLIDLSLLMKHSFFPAKAEPLMRHLLNGCMEFENEAISLAVDNINALVDEAVEYHGRGYFLGLSNNGIELYLSQFPRWCGEFILDDLGQEVAAEEICLYDIQ